MICACLRQEHQLLLEKLSALEKKVIVGGVDLLAKAEEQERLLQESNKELEERRQRAEQLHKELAEKEVLHYMFYGHLCNIEHIQVQLITIIAGRPKILSFMVETVSNCLG